MCLPRDVLQTLHERQRTCQHRSFTCKNPTEKYPSILVLPILHFTFTNPGFFSRQGQKFYASWFTEKLSWMQNVLDLHAYWRLTNLMHVFRISFHGFVIKSSRRRSKRYKFHADICAQFCSHSVREQVLALCDLGKAANLHTSIS